MIYETNAFLGWVQLHVLLYCCAVAQERSTSDSTTTPESITTPVVKKSQ
jgi:hypothetical protein